MMNVVADILGECGIQPVLCDIGASGAPPEIWAPIAERSTYVGFDPDEREFGAKDDSPFRRTEIIRKAVTADETVMLRFHLTSNPFCSSTLRPDGPALGDYLFANYFEVNRDVEVPATTLNAALASLGLSSVDWFKTDSQGTDLRLFTSLDPAIRERTLAVDVEPGLIDAYCGEDLFADTHTEMRRQGFWLSRLRVHGAVRMKRATLSLLAAHGLDERTASSRIRPSPGWCEARYLRTVSSLVARGDVQREFVLLWAFALLDDQLGYAFEVSQVQRSRFGAVRLADMMDAEVVRRLRGEHASWGGRARRILTAVSRRLSRGPR
jgi:hypothetical protein